MEQIAPGAPSRSLRGAVRRVWREEGWRGVLFRLQVRLGWLGLHPRAVGPPPLRRPDWITIGGARESFARTIDLPAATDPTVSVVLLDAGGVDDTLCSLAAIGRHPMDVSAEVIVVGGRPEGDASGLLSLVKNLVFVRIETGQAPAAALNEAARVARGRLLMLVRNGVQVLPGGADALVAAFDDPSVALAGSRVVSRTGRLEEAWAVLGSDGRRDPIGRGEDPRQAVYGRMRSVDYCSSASVMIAREEFLDLGGFDALTSPFHLEELCLRVRSRGRSVVYVPDAVVVQGSPETAPEAGALAPRVEVPERLRDRWSDAIAKEGRVRAIAFYLPQYHPIPENETWWGRGFTEWMNVARAKPLYRGHVQPRVPADLGFYDLRLPETRDAQAALAAGHGLSGFCYYYYWFHGRRLLERPLVEMLEQKRPAFPFCICWANENWTRRWDGHEAEVLIGQEHSPEDDRQFIESLLPFFADERYVRIDGRPLLLLYRARLLPDLERTAAIWRKVTRSAGLGDLYLAAVQSFDTGEVDPRSWGFDAAVEFPPHGYAVAARRPRGARRAGRFFDYARSALAFAARPLPSYPLFRTVMPSWDNSPRRKHRAHIFLGDSPGAYERWLRTIVDQTRRYKSGDERIVFINAWNEWAEGNYLEPDLDRGRSYLEATARALGPRDE